MILAICVNIKFCLYELGFLLEKWGKKVIITLAIQEKRSH